MATITIRNLKDETKKKLRQQAARHGHSMEEEVRLILDQAVNQTDQKGFGTWIHEQFVEFSGVELEIPARSPISPPPIFDGET